MSELFVALITPFDSPEGEVNLAAIPLHLRWLEQHGVDGVVPCGTTGEGPSLSIAERRAVIDTVMEQRGSLRVFAGTGCVALPETIALTRYAIERGVEAAMVIPPFFFKNLCNGGLLAYYRAVCDAVPPGGKILLYHIPPISQIPISTAVLDGLLESHPEHIYGVKDSGGDAEYTKMLAQRYPQLNIYDGSAPLLARTLTDGAAGGIFALANAFPGELRAVIEAHTGGADTTALQQRVTAIEQAFRPHVPLAALKALLPHVADLPVSSVRAPLVNLTPVEADMLWKSVRKL